MSSKRCYYDDAYTTGFSANVKEKLAVDSYPAVILDNTYFYPTSGGQPHDLGTINGVEVIDVIERSSDHAILHVSTHEIPQEEVACQIDWTRRFDHMQQHTGQHVLSRALLDMAGSDTVSFHLGAEVCTIDLSAQNLQDELLDGVELLANNILWENRPVLVEYYQSEEIGALSLRSEPGVDRQEIRLINIQDFDVTGCGGTHVSATGEIGLIKIIRAERFRGGTRVTFKCGRRALEDYQFKNGLVNQLSANFTTSILNIPQSVDKLQSQLKSQRQNIKRLQKRTAELQASEIYRKGIKIGSFTVVSENLVQSDPGELNMIASLVAHSPKTIALLGCNDPRLYFVFCRSDDAPGKMNELLSTVLDGFDSANGGGSEKLAQGGGAKASSQRVTEALKRAEEMIAQQII